MSVTNEQLCFDKKLLDMIKKNNEAGNIEVYYMIKNKKLHRFVDNAGNTLLHFASKYHNLELIQDLIDVGSEVNVQNLEGKTPIFLALEEVPDARMPDAYVRQCQLISSVEILCEAKADIHIVDKYGNSAANLVFGEMKSTFNKSISKVFFRIIKQQCVNNNELIAKKLISSGCSLRQAVFFKNSEVIEYMIREGCPVDGNPPYGRQTALHFAVSIMDLKIVEVLMKWNADVTIKDGHGYTPLAYYGCHSRPNEKQYPEIVKILLKKMLALYADNKERVLYCETRKILEFGSKEAIQIILFDNRLFIGNHDSHSPLHLLARNTARNYNSDIYELLSRLLQSKIYNVNACDLRRYTPLHYAVTHYGSHINVLKALLENGADVNAAGIMEYVPLFLLCQSKMVQKKKYHKIVRLLIQYGLDVQFCGRNDITVFDIIIENKLFYKAKILLAHLAVLEEQGNHLKEHIRFKISYHSMLKNYFSFCKDKLRKMKRVSINRQLTLYSFLVEQDDTIIKSCKLEQNALLKLKGLTKKHSNYYYHVIQQRISRIVMTLTLRIQSRSIICNLLKIIDDPNHVVVTEIVNYLNNENMKNLCELGM